MSSGDVGHFDDAGRLFIDGRDDDMIVSGGENVFPAEVEDLLAGPRGVREVAVFGVDDEKFGQRLKAVVVLARTALTRRRGQGARQDQPRRLQGAARGRVRRRAPAHVDRQGPQARAQRTPETLAITVGMAQRTDLFSTSARLGLSSGEGRRLDLHATLEPFELGGETYVATPAAVPVRLDVSRTTGNGYALRLRFAASLEGPCMRCLGPAAPRLRRRRPRGDQPGGGDELQSRTSTRRRARPARLGARLVPARDAGPDHSAAPDCARPVPDLRGQPQRRVRTTRTRPSRTRAGRSSRELRFE